MQYVGERIATESRAYKFGATNLDFTLCMNREYDSNGMAKGDCYIVESLRDEDCFKKSSHVYTVTHILAKDNTERLYTDIVFMDKATDMQELPQEVSKMVDGELLGH